ncbi:MAG: N-acetylmuramoyl-L-alanine amidase [Candidatus Latescibacterota bacterium]|nr:MAG: N-acetylmuramoyl-L-alanine amidase [Candidatus Latescibacterota bacterium]
MMKTVHWLFPVLVIALALSCAKGPKPKIETIYEGLNENLPRLDTSILEGRTILIDPGHGGHFRGTEGQGGLDESMANLGVGLYLWGLLREAGAEVHLTRSAEKDFLGDTDSTVATDLHARVELVDSIAPDILVSIHHNADAGRDPATNRVETYYKLGDPASRDLAFAVHRHLMRNLGIENGEVRPGNYYILRNVDVPAIIGEGSYLTHPGVEENLRLSEKQRLEAEAYFLGVLDYFSRGTPRIERTSPGPTDTVLTEIPYLSYRVTDAGGLGIDPSGIDLLINGGHGSPWLDRDNGRIGYPMPWDAPNGWYDVVLRVRNLLGNSGQVDRCRFLLNHPASQAVFSCFPPNIPSGGGTVHAYARLLDDRGIPVADSMVVDVEVAQRQTSGGDWIPIEISPGTTRVEMTVYNGTIEIPVTVPEGTAEVRLSVGGHEHVLDVTESDDATANRVFSLVDGTTGRSITRAAVVSAGMPIAVDSHTGTYFVPDASNPDTDAFVRAPGYRPLSLPVSITDTVTLDPWFGGVLHGKRIVINPQGGFGPEPGLGQLGLSGPFVNLQIARYLAEYLEAAGAVPLLTRRSEETLSDRDIVAMTNRWRADRYIEIRHTGHHHAKADTGRAVNCYFFPGSDNGKKLASDIQHALATSLDLAVLEPADRVTYPLQQTACPAIIVEPPSMATIDEELRLGEPWYQRLQAYGIFCGMLTHFGADNVGSLEVTISHTPSNENTVSNWLVTIDDTWRLISSPAGTVHFATVPAGTLEVITTRGRDRTEPQRAAVAAGSRERLVITVPTGR